jgi:ParB family chromosome partitioning protein
LPDEIDQRLGEIETALAAFDNRPVTYEQAEITHAGAFVSIDGEGALRFERGFVRPEDEAAALSVTGGESDAPRIAGSDSVVQGAVITIGGAQNSDADTSEEDDAIRPLSDRLVTELTADRTLALRDALANEPNVAFQAVLHALCLSAFYRHSSNSCLEITAKNSGFSAQAPGLAETASARAIDARHGQWATRLPENSADLWDALTAFDRENKTALFAHCAALTVNGVKEPWNRRPDAFAHGDQLARAVDLDMAAAGWTPTVENYLGRVPKFRIIEAVREAKGDQSARLIEHLKKADMAREAERLLDGTGWLPEPLRVARTGMEVDAPIGEAGEADGLPDFLGEDKDDAQLDAEEEQPHAAIAAE